MLIKSVPGCKEKACLDVKGFSQNSSLVKEGDLFFALKGEKVDGHIFLKDVAKKKAVGAVVSNDYDGDSYGIFLFRSKDVLASLQALASSVFKKRKSKLIAITGSVGKTLTKEFTATLLEGTYKIFKNPGSCNSQITFPLNILNAIGDEDFLILEMGMSLPNEIKRLVSIAPPYLALITKIALAHSVNFPLGLESIAKEKASIFLSEQTKHKIFNHQLYSFFSDLKGTSFSITNQSANYYLELKEKLLNVYEKKEIKTFLSPFVEMHLLEDLLGAISIARTLNVSWEEIEKKLKNLSLPKMRFERVKKRGVLFIKDCYNANSESMLAALNNFPIPEKKGRKIAVLGPMKELGDFSDDCHQKIAEEAIKKTDIAIFFGEEWHVAKNFIEENKSQIFLDKKELLEKLKKLLFNDDVALIKASRAMYMEEIVEKFE
jgi:UDP-N-acetylmuramoyl-tripeptide--D-alanyl-D-alanine ligase